MSHNSSLISIVYNSMNYTVFETIYDIIHHSARLIVTNPSNQKKPKNNQMTPLRYLYYKYTSLIDKYIVNYGFVCMIALDYTTLHNS